MAKKKGPDMKRMLIEEGKSVSPFQNIVLREKKEESKKPVAAPPRKKPNEIVQGYVPSASFADILESYEKTGNPYSMPKKKASAGVGSSYDSSASFADILDQWEGKGKPKKKAKPQEKVEKPLYQPTKSFGDILSSYDKQAAKKKAAEVPAPEKKAKPVDRDLRFFLSETEEDKVAPGVSWSIYGGANKDFKREEKKSEAKEEEKKEYVRSTPRYVPQKSFSDILVDYSDSKRKKVEAQPVAEPPKPVKEEVKVEEPNFFQEIEEGESVPANVSWSIYGGANKGYVRPEVPKVEEKKEELPKTVKPVSKPYEPKKDFGAILSSYDTAKAKAEPAPVKDEKPKTEEEKAPEPNFFKEMEEGDEVPATVSWSIFGGANRNYVRPEKPVEKEEEKEAPIQRSTDPYVPTKSFGKVLSEYKPKDRVRTFDEIIKDKGDNTRQTRSYTINELRRMDPQATLDLHGETQADSEAQVKAFLEESKAHGLRKISVITGKGLHSEDGQGVLRTLAERVIDASGLMAERSSAPLNKGGSGAIWVILKENQEE